MELKYVAAKKPEAANPTVQRRLRLVRRIDQQISLITAAKDGALPRASWAWLDEKGGCFLHLKYGRNSIELKKGMFAIECATIEEAAEALGTVRTMVLKGDFDEQLTRASADIRKRFKASDL